MVRFTANCRFDDLQPQALFAIERAHELYLSFGIAEMWLTSVDDSEHKKGSLHPKGFASDHRIWNVPPAKVKPLADAIRKRLSPGWQVILESDHIHIEYDPK